MRPPEGAALGHHTGGRGDAGQVECEVTRGARPVPRGAHRCSRGGRERLHRGALDDGGFPQQGGGIGGDHVAPRLGDGVDGVGVGRLVAPVDDSARGVDGAAA